MRKSIYTPKTSDVISVEYDDQLRGVIVVWKNLNSDEIRPCSLAQYEALKKYRGTFVIIDLSQAEGVLKPEDQVWFETLFYPQIVRETPIKKIITVLPKSAATGLSAKQYRRSAEKHGIEMYECTDLAVALEVLK